ncbi:MAG TPA: hypothetical protein VFM54_16190, partial [Micromonosporaceae bacterium]|nr:hypothetical protein [Micromonosporaceae bacterium]
MLSNPKVMRRVIGAGLVLIAVGWALAGADGHRGTGVQVMAAGLALVGLPAWLGWRRRGGDAVMARWQRRTRAGKGTATWWDVLTSSSGWVMRRKAVVLRPSLRGVSWWRRWRTPVRSYATPLCRAAGLTVWTSCEESTLRLGIPGTGKTAELACRVVDAPGGVVVTSTATDLYELTAPLRRRRGPVQVFNPSGIGGAASTLRWSPLSGCTDPATAARRAVDLMGPGSGSPEGERWEVQGRRVLAVLLHA